jgi:hypothetical protein
MRALKVIRKRKRVLRAIRYRRRGEIKRVESDKNEKKRGN